jgi:hypothetical protein
MQQPDEEDLAAQQPDDESLASVLAGLQNGGFGGNLRRSGSDVVCGTCQSVLRPDELLVHRLRRLEGASDPADMLAVVAATCPGCGTDGTLVLGFGPSADPDDGALLVALDVPPDLPPT